MYDLLCCLLFVVLLPGCGCPHLSRKVRKTPRMRIYLFLSLALTNFGVWVSAALSAGEQLVEVLLSVSADAVITYLFMPCVPRLIIASRKLTCTFSLCENSEHQRFF